MPRVPRHEVPPTAGLPLRLADLWPGRGRLTEGLAAQWRWPGAQLASSGTAALLLALRVLRGQRPQRSVVVVPAFTCPLVAIAVQQAGLRLRPCDVRAGHFDLDPQALAEACREDTLAVLPTHLAGRVADVDTAVALAAGVGAFVIEDAAQALGARDRGISVGLRGDLGFFSLAAGKGLSIYEGGLLVSRNPALREAFRQAAERQLPARPGWEARRCLELLGLAALYRPRGLGIAYGRPLRRALRRGDPVAAVGDAFPPTVPLHRVGRWRQAVGARAAVRLPGFLDALRIQAANRVQRLRCIDGVEVFGDAPGREGTWPCLVVRCPDARSRDAALARLWTRGLGVSRLFIHALPDYGYLADRVPSTPVPNARDVARRTLTVSNSPWLDDAAFDEVVAGIAQAVG